MSSQKLNKEELLLLLKFFPAEVSESHKLTFSRLKGYLVSLALSPVTITPEKWWEAVKALPDVSFENKEQEIEVCKILIKIDDKIKEGLTESVNQVPEYQDLSIAEAGSTAVEQWCLGFMDGVLVCEDIWFSTEDKSARENLELAFGVVSLIANREHIRKEMREADYDKRIDESQKFLPQVVLKLNEIRNSSIYDHFKIDLDEETSQTIH